MNSTVTNTQAVIRHLPVKHVLYQLDIAQLLCESTDQQVRTDLECMYAPANYPVLKRLPSWVAEFSVCELIIYIPVFCFLLNPHFPLLTVSASSRICCLTLCLPSFCLKTIALRMGLQSLPLNGCQNGCQKNTSWPPGLSWPPARLCRGDSKKASIWKKQT